MAKPWYRKKASRSRKPYTKNGRRHNSPTKTTIVFSEDSIQRQLGYLVPQNYDHSNVYDEGYEEGPENPDDCCWHYCGHAEWIWCCGQTCLPLDSAVCSSDEGVQTGEEGLEHEVYSPLDVGHGMDMAVEPVVIKDLSGDDLAVMDAGVVDPGTAEVSRGDEETSEDGGVEIDSMAYRAWRDGWICDFCGTDCLCWTVGADGGVDI